MAVPAPPFMHGAAHWAAFTSFSNGGTVIVPDVVDRFDAPSVVDLIAREEANVLLLVGDSFARPLLDAIDASGPFDLVPALAEPFPVKGQLSLFAVDHPSLPTPAASQLPLLA